MAGADRGYGCSDDADGTCEVSVGTFIGAGTGYVWGTEWYCATESQCQSFCDSVDGREGYGGCSWNELSACQAPLPEVRSEYYCAVALTVDCGGDGGERSVACYGNCSDIAGKSDSDEYGCYSHYDGVYGEGMSCEEAVADLDRNDAPCPTSSREPVGARVGRSCSPASRSRRVPGRP